jgi:transcriptional regulator with GAF, ATPase, and Fis domain
VIDIETSDSTYTLRVELSGGRSFTHPLTLMRTVMGRSVGADLVLEAVGVSREHAALVVRDDGVWVEDLGSTNGTRLNGSLLEAPRRLRDGDELALGHARLTLQCGTPQSVSFLPPQDEGVVEPTPEAVDPVTPSPVAEESPPPTNLVPSREGTATDDERRALRILYYVGRAMELDASEPELWERIVDVAVRALEPERAMLMLGEAGLPPEPKVVFNESGLGFAITPNIVERVLGEGVSIMTIEQTGEGGPSDGRTVLCVPVNMQTSGRERRPLGLLYVDARVGRRKYAPRDLDLLTIVANHAAALLEKARLLAKLRLATEQLAAENVQLREEIQARFGFGGILGGSGPMEHVLRTLQQLVKTDSTVLITGESGTGKELIARTIHHNSPRRDGPFVAINCAAIPENLLEAELFGIEKGVATGVDRRPGKFELAGDGTLFLDEISEIPLQVQVKLLRVLEEREFERIGGRSPIRVRARIVAATNRDLAEQIADGRFREDLYYRLNVVPIRLPPLRERLSDLAVLGEAFLRRFAEAQGKPIRGFTPETLELLRNYPWAGNVRELQNEIERIVTIWEPDPQRVGAELIQPYHLAERIRSAPPVSSRVGESLELGNIKEVVARLVEQAEVNLIRRALARSQGNKGRAAELLGLTREGLRKKMIRYRFARGDEAEER